MPIITSTVTRDIESSPAACRRSARLCNRLRCGGGHHPPPDGGRLAFQLLLGSPWNHFPNLCSFLARCTTSLNSPSSRTSHRFGISDEGSLFPVTPRR